MSEEMTVRAEKAEARVKDLEAANDAWLWKASSLDTEFMNRMIAAESSLAAMRGERDAAWIKVNAIAEMSATIAALRAERDEAVDLKERAMKALEPALVINDLLADRAEKAEEQVSALRSQLAAKDEALSGVCAIFKNITPGEASAWIERCRAALTARLQAEASKEEFFCCKDQDNPCHPIRDYCSRGRPASSEKKP